jgi:hypothetical protein
MKLNKDDYYYYYFLKKKRLQICYMFTLHKIYFVIDSSECKVTIACVGVDKSYTFAF